MATRTMRIVIDVSVYGGPEPRHGDRTADRLMAARVIDAIIPHPDSNIATEKAGEHVTVTVNGWEVTS